MRTPVDTAFKARRGSTDAFLLKYQTQPFLFGVTNDKNHFFKHFAFFLNKWKS